MTKWKKRLQTVCISIYPYWMSPGSILEFIIQETMYLTHHNIRKKRVNVYLEFLLWHRAKLEMPSSHRTALKFLPNWRCQTVHASNNVEYLLSLLYNINLNWNEWYISNNNIYKKNRWSSRTLKPKINSMKI